MEDTNNENDILLDRKQLDQVMKSISKQPSHSEYQYLDTDNFEYELDEFFNYTEISLILQQYSTMVNHTQKDLRKQIEKLLDQLESVYEQRIDAANKLLLISLGDFQQMNHNKIKYLESIKKNNLLLYNCGAFYPIFQALKHVFNQLYQISQIDNIIIDTNEEVFKEIDLYLTILYLIIETNRQEGIFGDKKDALDVEFLEFLLINLSQLKDSFTPSFPIKKLLLLIWKTLLSTLGGVEKVKGLKHQARERNGLNPLSTAYIPKCSSHDLFTFQNDITFRYPTYSPSLNNKFTLTPMVIKASPALAAAMGITNATNQTTLPYQLLFPPRQQKGNEKQSNNQQLNNDNFNFSDTVVLPLVDSGPSVPTSITEATDIYQKYLQISLSDHQIILERQRAINRWQNLKQNKINDSKHVNYLSIANSTDYNDENNKMAEDDMNNNDIFNIMERLYTSIAPELQGTVIVLLKILLTTATNKMKSNNKNNTDATNTQQDSSQPSMETADTERNREILCKSISAIFILLLKWFKISHILKYEYFSQLLVDSGCMLLILKIFGLQEIAALSSIKTNIDEYNLFEQIASHPSVSNLEEKKDKENGLSTQGTSIESKNQNYTNGRNIFWIINLLRVLQMLSKNKIHRIMVLVQYKSAAIFKRVYKISHPKVELYALKNLKNQIPFLGRKWRSVNMKMVSAIYFHCTPDLREDWLITRSDKESDLEDGKMEEINLRILIRLYHGRKYLPKLLPDDDSTIYENINKHEPFSASLILENNYHMEDDLMNDNFDLDDDFKMDYQKWLENEVYNKKLDDDDNDDGDSDDNNKLKNENSQYDGTPATPIPASPICQPIDSGYSPALLAQGINKLYQEELNKEFNKIKSQKYTIGGNGWDSPIIQRNTLGEKITNGWGSSSNSNNYGDDVDNDNDINDFMDEDDEDDEDDDNKKFSITKDPLGNINWETITEDELTQRLTVVEERTVQRWMNIDINDPRYLKVLNTFEDEDGNPIDEPAIDQWT
ncbi:unnamed protein product [Cunninghamella blakesleeana]